MERIEGHDPSDDGIEGPSPSKYALSLFIFFLIGQQTSFL